MLLKILIFVACLASESLANGVKRPNIVFVLTDDQDVFLGGMVPMEKTRKILEERGIKFVNMFTTTPICCPSRASILTGLYMNTHRTVNNSISGNCNSIKWQQNGEKSTFASLLKRQANYTTFFAGKYLNQYGRKKVGGVRHVPPGWDSWHGLVGNSVYYNYKLSANGKVEHHGTNPRTDYLTNVINKKAMRFLDTYDGSRSFMMMLSTPACHAPFTPEPKYSNRYRNISAPRTPNFFKHPGKAKHWLLRQVPQEIPDSVVNFTDNVFRHRWQTLLSVDNLVHDLYKKLEAKKLLDNTYIFFSSDNGFHLGQFSLPYDKRQLYEFDIRIPLLVAGPGIAPASQRVEPVLNIDLAPTFLELAGLNVPSSMDGKSLVPLLKLARSKKIASNWRTSFYVEYQGNGKRFNPGCPQYNDQDVANCQPDCICEDARNNTYTCIRTMTNSQNTILCRFHDNENFVEAYNMTNDAYQMNNLAYDWQRRTCNSRFNFQRS